MFDEEELEAEINTEGSTNNYVVIPNSDEKDSNYYDNNNAVNGKNVTKGERGVHELVDDIDAIADRIKSMSHFTSKEEAELEKTLQILRGQLIPKRRKKKEAFKKFPFVIFKNPYTKPAISKPVVHAKAVV